MAQKFLHDITILGSDGSTATIQGAGQSTLNLKTTTNSKNNYIVGSTSGSLSFRPNGTETLTLNSQQYSTFASRVGIGVTASTNAMLDVKGPDTNNAVLGRFYSNTGARGSFIIRNGTGVDPTTFIGTAGGSEQLSIGTNNVEAIRILASNSPGNSRVGIGTSTPTHNLSVSSASTSQTALTIANTSTGASRIYIDASNGDVSGSDYIWFGQNNDLTSEIQLAQNAGSFSIKSQPSGTVQSNLVVTQAGVVTLHNAGNVKLATTGGGVDITGSITATDGTDTTILSHTGLALSRSNSYIQSNADNSDTLNIGQSSVRWGHVKVDAADFAVFNGGNERFKINSSGNATFAGTINAPDGSATTPSYNFTSHDGNGMYLEEYDASNNKEQVSIATDGVRRFRANEAGIWSDQNVYFTGSLRKFGEWQATSGTAGEGFKFENTADSTTPLTITSTGNATIAGNLTVNGNTQLGNALTDKVVIHGHLGIGHESYPKIAYPGQNALWGEANNSTTGQVVIDLPGTLANFDMMYMEIDIYEYNSTNATKLIIGAHNWNSGANAGTGNLMWYNVGVTVIGGLTKPVYLGWRNDGTNNRRVIAIGDTNSTWAYPTIHVAKVHGNDGYNTQMDWVGDWSINLTTSNSYFTKSPNTNYNSTAANTFETSGRGIFGGSVSCTTLIPTSHIYLGATKRLYLDGGGDTYITESSSDTVQIVTGSTITAEFAGTALTLRNTTFNGNILTATDSTFDIGTNTARFRNIYADTLYGDGSNLTNLPSPSAPSNMVTTDTNQSISGNKTFEGNVTLKSAAVAKLKAAPLGSTYGAGFDVMTVTGTSSAPYTSTIGFSNYSATDVLKLEGTNATFAGNVSITGDLNITGDINSTSVTNLDVDDKTITIAKGAANSAAADGAGIVVDGAGASLLYDHSGTQWEFNKPVEVKVNNSAITMTEYNNGAVIWLDGSDGDFIGGDYYNVAAYGGGSGSKLSFGYGAGEKMYMDMAGNLLTYGVIDVSGTGVSTFAGSVKVKNALIDNTTIPDIDSTTTTVASVAKATYTAAFFDYVIKKGTNVRSGTVYACHDGTNVEFAETSTVDLGDTSDVTLTVAIDSSNMMFKATTTSNDWSVKSLIRAI